VLPVKLLLDLLLLELLPRETQLRRFVESGDSAGLYCVDRGFRIADEGLVSAVELDVTEVALLLPPGNYITSYYRFNFRRIKKEISRNLNKNLNNCKKFIFVSQTKKKNKILLQ